MPWSAWICITVMFTYGFAQETQQQNRFNDQGNPNSNLIPNSFNFQSDLTNALSFQVMNQINQQDRMLPNAAPFQQAQTPGFPMEGAYMETFPHPMQSRNVPNMPNFQGVQNKRQFQRKSKASRFRIINTSDVDEEVTWKDYLENAVPWGVCETFVHGLFFIPKMLPDQVFRDWIIGQGCQEVLFKVAIPMFSRMFGHSFYDMHF